MALGMNGRMGDSDFGGCMSALLDERVGRQMKG